MATEEIRDTGYRKWTSPNPRAVFLLVHGLGGHAGRWETAGNFFASRGITSYAPELGKDISVKNLKKMIHPSLPGETFLVGESMGALVSFLLAVEEPRRFSGLICLSPAFSSLYKPTFTDSVKMLTPLLYNHGKLVILPFDSSECTRDPVYRKKMDEDPAEYRSISSRRVFELLLAQARARILKDKMKTPVLFLVAGQDKIVDTAATRRIFDELKGEDKTLIEFPDMYHSLSIDTGREKVFEEILQWVEKRI